MVGDHIKEALNSLGIKNYYITRGKNEPPCIVYNYTTGRTWGADNKIDSIEFIVLLNVQTFNNVEKIKYDVVETMLEHGFTSPQILSTLQEQGAFFNTPIQFRKIIERR